MDKYITEIEAMLHNGNVDTHRVRSIIEEAFSDIRVLAYIIPKGNTFIRLRINDGDKLYDNVSELSYPPKDLATLQRASLAMKPLFYATPFTTSTDENNMNMPRITTLYETCLEVRNITDSINILGTYSKWECTKDLYLFAFPICIKKYERICKEAIDIDDLWYEANEADQNKNKINFLRFIGNIISTKNRAGLYDITATISDEILKIAGDKLDGVIYPTVQVGGDGLNIAIKPNIIDDYFSCINARVCRITKYQGKVNIHNIYNANIDKKSNVIYTNYRA